MKNKKAKKAIYIVISGLWVISTAMWTITAWGNFTVAGFPRFLLALQCATAVFSGGAAVASYISYKRSNNDNSE